MKSAVTIKCMRLGIIYLLISSISHGKVVASGDVEFQGAYSRWTAQELTVGNTHFERKWQIKIRQLSATSFRNIESGMEWIRKPAATAAPLTEMWDKSIHSLTISATPGRLDVTGEESLQVTVHDASNQALMCQFRIFPEASGVEITLGSAIRR